MSSLSIGQLALVMDNTSSPKKLANTVRPFKMRKFTPDEDLECDESQIDDEGSPKIQLREISGDDPSKCQKRKRKTEREL